MGGHLVKLVTTRWSHISDRAFRVLTVMAVTALDAPTDSCEAGVYFAGQEPLLAALRNERGGTRETRERTVKKAITELIKEKAIERVVTGRVGRKAIYRLRLDGAAGVDLPGRIEGDSQSPPVGDPQGPAQGGRWSPAEGDPQGPRRGTAGVPPRNHREDQEKEPRSGNQGRTGGAPPPDPRRRPPASPSASDSDRSLSEPLTPAQDQEGESLPRTRTREADTAELRLVTNPRPDPGPEPLIPPHTPAAVADAMRRMAAARHAHRSAS
jgi:hypothetical protein